MNVFDFDKTIYGSDSTIDFYFYCLRRKPIILICSFKQLYGVFMHSIGKISTTEMKSRFFSFLPLIDDVDSYVQNFWEIKEKNINDWYLKIKRDDDVIISASPEFLLIPICKKIGVTDPIATKMNVKTGKILGVNCKGKEKVKRFFEKHQNGLIKEFYSDSKSDTPLAEISQKAYLIKKDKLYSWGDK